MHQEAQPIATLRKPNERGQSRIQCKRSNNKPDQINEVTSFLKIVPVSIQSGGNRLNTYAFLNSGSTVSFIDQIMQEKLRSQGTDATLNIGCKYGTKDLKTEIVPLKIKGLHSNRSVCTPVNILGKHKLQLQQAEAKLQSLECSTQKRLQIDGSWHHALSRCLWATTPIGLQDRNTKWNFRRSNRARMGSQWTYEGQ